MAGKFFLFFFGFKFSRMIFWNHQAERAQESFPSDHSSDVLTSAGPRKVLPNQRILLLRQNSAPSTRKSFRHTRNARSLIAYAKCEFMRNRFTRKCVYAWIICRSLQVVQEFSNAYLVANIGVDTIKNQQKLRFFQHHFGVAVACRSKILSLS